MGFRSGISEAVAVSPVRKTLFFAAALLGLLVIFGASGDTVFAKGPPEAFSLTAFVAVTGFEDAAPAGPFGRVRVKGETLLGEVVSSSDLSLVGMVVNLRQSSNEIFSEDPTDPNNVFTVLALDGRSHGTFDILDPTSGEVLANGAYQISVSNDVLNGGFCQIIDSGTWSTTGGGLDARGTLEGCLFGQPVTFPTPGGGQVTINTLAGLITLTGTIH